MNVNTAVKIENLSKTYKNGVQALKHINLDVAEGDFFALLGPNGAGKSTTIGILSSLVVKSSGQVLIMGYDLERTPFQAKQQLGVMPQEINLTPFESPLQILLTQASYYGIPAAIATKRALMLLEKLDLLSKKDDQVRMLSGGMKRRVMIARALIHDPRVVILDEPTAGVDVELRKLMWDFLTELNCQGLTIILTTHYLEEAENLCRNLAIIHQGEVIRSGKMAQLLHELEQETLLLDLAEPLEQTPKIPWKMDLIHPKQLAVHIERGQSINALFLALEQAQIKVVSLRNEANRLEQLFIKLIRKGS